MQLFDYSQLIAWFCRSSLKGPSWLQFPYVFYACCHFWWSHAKRWRLWQQILGQHHGGSLGQHRGGAMWIFRCKLLCDARANQLIWRSICLINLLRGNFVKRPPHFRLPWVDANKPAANESAYSFDDLGLLWHSRTHTIRWRRNFELELRVLFLAM